MLPEPFTPAFLNQLETLRLRTRKEFLGGHSGSYGSPRRGTSLEFADYRRYVPGDDLRYLDWGIYARSDRLYVKLFREEVDLFAYLFIDASASMAFPSVREKFLPASHIGAALSYVVLANHDHVKIHLLGEPSASIPSPFYRGRSAGWWTACNLPRRRHLPVGWIWQYRWRIICRNCAGPEKQF